MQNKLLNTLVIGAFGLLLTACGNDKEAPNTYPDQWPKPDATSEGPIPGSAEDFHKSVKDRVFFALNKHTLTPESKATLTAQSEWLKKWPSVNVVVEGHADERGTTEYNLALGEKRAHAAKKDLMAGGVDGSRIEVVSYGKEHPEDAGHDEAAWAKNRRAVTVIR